MTGSLARAALTGSHAAGSCCSGGYILAAEMAAGPRVLADGWYSWEIPGFRPLTDLIARWPKPLQALSWRVGPLRSALLFAASLRYDLVAVIRADRGWRSLLLLRALLGRRRKLVVLHFIDHPLRGSGIAAVFDRLWRGVDRWAVRRAVLRAQVLSPGERELYAGRFGVEVERFSYLPFAWRLRDDDPLESAPQPERQLVLALGRALCDWPTLFAAARGSDWTLVVICGANDQAAVERLNRERRAEVLAEVSPERALELMRQAAICVLPLQDLAISQGHVRLCDANDAGAAVVASRVAGLEGYVEDGRTAVLVTPGSPDELERAIERLLGRPEERVRLVRASLERGRVWTWRRYMAAVEDFVRDGAASMPRTEDRGQAPAI
jgi:glycosyltransferase involved in cell wall biosynthesis